MAIDISALLTPEQKKEILTNRLTGWAADYYSNDLNKKALLAADPNADVSVQEANLAALETAITTAQADLAAL